MEFGIILAIIGIILTILLSTPLIDLFTFYFEDMKRRQWSGARYREGGLQDKSHIGFDDWSAFFEIDDDGNCSQFYDVRVINLSDKLVERYYIPVFCDAAPLTFEDARAWGRVRRKALRVESDNWNADRAEGRVKLMFDKPIAPGERKRFQYGLTLPKLFQVGDDYYNWDVEVPHYDMQCEMKFSEIWEIKYARWRIKDRQFISEPHLLDNVISWKISFPPRHTRLHLQIGLIKRT